VSTIRRIEIPIGIYIFVSMFIIFRYYFGIGKELANVFTSAVVIIATFTLLIGAINLVRYQMRRIQRRESGWYYTPLLLGSAAIFVVLGFVDKSKYLWVQTNLLTTLETAMLSYVGMYMYTATYRAARTRSLDAGVLLFITIILLIDMMPMGAVIFPGIQNVAQWIRQVPNTGSWKAFTIGLGLGLLALMVRTWLGIERAYLGRER